MEIDIRIMENSGWRRL